MYGMKKERLLASSMLPTPDTKPDAEVHHSHATCSSLVHPLWVTLRVNKAGDSTNGSGCDWWLLKGHD